jgi:hypothetical protein
MKKHKDPWKYSVGIRKRISQSQFTYFHYEPSIFYGHKEK